MLEHQSVFHSNSANDKLWTAPTFHYKTEIPHEIKHQSYLYKILENSGSSLQLKKKYFIFTEYSIYYQKVAFPVIPL